MKVQYVNVYMIDRAWGGPEEGGWWYDWGTPVKTLPVLPDKAARLLGKVRDWCDKENEERPDIDSVLSEGVYSACVEDHPAEAWPSERPRYE